METIAPSTLLSLVLRGVPDASGKSPLESATFRCSTRCDTECGCAVSSSFLVRAWRFSGFKVKEFNAEKLKIKVFIQTYLNSTYE